MESAPPEQATRTSGCSPVDAGCAEEFVEEVAADEVTEDEAAADAEDKPVVEDELFVALVAPTERATRSECSVSTSWSTRRTARRIAATAGWGPMSGALREKLGGASVGIGAEAQSLRVRRW